MPNKGRKLVQGRPVCFLPSSSYGYSYGKTKKALEKYPVKTLVVAGGVAANKGLRERLAAEITDVKVIIPPLRLCGDNAGMIAYASVSEWNKRKLCRLRPQCQNQVSLLIL